MKEPRARARVPFIKDLKHTPMCVLARAAKPCREAKLRKTPRVFVANERPTFCHKLPCTKTQRRGRFLPSFSFTRVSLL